MRLNGKKVTGIMAERGLNVKMVCSRTGLYEESLGQILENGYVSGDAADRIGDAVGVEVSVILLPDLSGNVENCIEFTKDSNRAGVTFSQGRYKSRIRKLAAERPEECKIVAENADGSIYAHIPVAWVKISPPKQYTDEQRQQMSERLHGNSLK